MSYLVLARKYRPRLFSEVVGQQPIVRTLQNALAQNRVAHALIFSGVRGTGKTTLARIMAKALNCENREGDTEPCNSCTSCLQINEGGSVDLQEVDGASNRGIQEIRELKDKIRFLPTSSRYKIIIIDEVHMLTTEAFNALLKTLEEPPEHVYFMFATTELHKVPLTILSRCQRYELKRISRVELSEHFQRLARQEETEIEPAALEMIVREAEGSVRDGLSLLDQVFSYCGTQVRVEDVVEVLGLVQNQTIADLTDAMLQRDLGAVFAQLENIYTQGMDFKRLSNELLAWFRNLVIYKINPGEDFFDLPEDDLERMRHSVAEQSLETLTAIFNLLLEGIEQAHFSAHPRLALELTFIRIFQVGAITPVGDLLVRLDRMIDGYVPDDPPAPLPREVTVPSPPPPLSSPQPPTAPPAPEQPSAPQSGATRSVERPQDTAAPASQPETPPPAETEIVRQPLDPPPEDVKPEQGRVEQDQPGDAAGHDDVRPGPLARKKDVRRDWDGFIAYVRDRQPWMAASLQRAAGAKKVAEELVVQFEDSIDCSLLRQKKYIKPLAEYVLDFFQENLTLRFDVPEGQECDISSENGKKPQLERRALANDPLVLTAVEIFNGQVGDIRIGPRFRKKTDESPGGKNAAAESSPEE